MADELDSQDGDETPRKGGIGALVLPIAGLVIGLGGGGAVGAKVVAPKLTAGITATPSASDVANAHTKSAKHGDDDEEGEHGDDDEEGDAEHDEEDGDKKKDEEHAAGPPPNYVMSDLVLNPAGSGGTRFVMMSVAFDMKDSAAVEKLKAHEAEIRDAMLAAVGSKTVEQLAEISAREPLKAEIKAVVGRITRKPKAIKRINFPQFVIQ